MMNDDLLRVRSIGENISLTIRNVEVLFSEIFLMIGYELNSVSVVICTHF